MQYEIIDTHAHLYLKAFNNDLDEMIGRAVGSSVRRIFLPNLDSTTIQELNGLCEQYKGICFPMIGLHPTSVDKNYREELKIIEAELKKDKYIAIAETVIDLYWDKT